MNKKWLAGPYLVWMVGFIVIPLLLIVYYGLTDKSGAFTLANVLSISTPEHVKALWLSLGLSLVSTVICLLLAYPLAMILRNRGIGQGSFIVFIFILPMWMNFLLRTLAWQTLLEKSGVEPERLEHFDTVYKEAAGEDTSILVPAITGTGKFAVKTPDVDIKVNPDRLDLVETRFIEGRRCLVIAVENNVEVNGMPVKMWEEAQN